MEEKKITKTKVGASKKKKSPGLVINILRGIQNVIAGTVETVNAASNTIAQGLSRRLYLFLLTIFSILFLCAGLSELMNVVYGMPGIGPITLGIFGLLLSLVIHVFNLQDRY